MGRLAVAAVLLLPRAALACPMCFGGIDNPTLGRAFNIGLFMLMGSTFGLLVAGITWLVRIERRRMAADAIHFSRLRESGAE